MPDLTFQEMMKLLYLVEKEKEDLELRLQLLTNKKIIEHTKKEILGLQVLNEKLMEIAGRRRIS